MEEEGSEGKRCNRFFKAIESCTKCLRCEQLCPDFAIVVFGDPGKPKA